MIYGFEEIVYEIPTNLIDIANLVQEAGLDEATTKLLRDRGLSKIPISREKNLADLVSKTISRLFSLNPNLLYRVKGILFAHSIPLICPQHISFFDLCLEGKGLNNIPRVAVCGQPCSILHFATKLAGYWLNDNSIDSGILLIGGDQAYAPADRIYFGSAMGDVAVAGLITRNTPRNRILSCTSHTKIICFQGEDSPQSDIALFRQLAPQLVRQSIMECLRQANLKLEDLTYIVPHTPYNAMWEPIAKLLRYPREKILTDYMCETGHLNSNDSFVHYVRAVNEGKIKEGDLALLVNPGFGGTRGCTLIQR